MRGPKLPDALLWNEGGHLTEEALAAVADGEEALLSEDALLHAHACEPCARGVGEAAVLSSSMTSLLSAALAESRAPVSRDAPVSQRSSPPFWALAFGLVFVAIGALPFLMGMRGLPAGIVRTALILKRAVPIFAHSAISLAGSDAVAFERSMVTLASLAVLLMSVFAVSRLTPREGIAR
jgi:hypothetical protein